MPAAHYDAESDTPIAAIRRFNRFYTRKIGVLDQQLLQSPFSLTEARVLFELAQQDDLTAREIGTRLGLDSGYLSRIVHSFTEKNLVTRKPVAEDKRQFRLSLTAKGRLAFGRLNQTSHSDVADMLKTLPSGGKQRLVEAMTTIERLLDDEARRPEVTLRMHRPGDMGWVVQQHGRLYAEEFGWDISFEGMVADIVAQFLKEFAPARERCWIAEIDSKQVGSVFLVRKSDEVAKLRMLLIDPAGRGIGLGKRLVDECIVFARQCGYRKITLWTQSMLLAARAIYENAGFVCVASEPHRSFGQDLVGETWELTL